MSPGPDNQPPPAFLHGKEAEPPWRRLILVASHRRSGSTWLAAILGEASDTRLVPYEPLWLKWHKGSPYNPQIQDWRARQGWHIGWDPRSGEDVQDSAMVRRHVSWLCGHYFDGPVGSLVIKEPHPNWLAFLAGALNPDHVIFLKRHPLGIINSYDTANLYTRWQVNDEWQRFLQDLPGLAPDLVSIAAGLRHPVERVALMIHTGNLLAARLETKNFVAVDYEQLCLEPQTRFRELFEALDLAWDEESWSRMLPLIDPDAEKVEDGFIQVRKRSYERAYAWRSELPWHLIRRVEQLMKKVDGDYPQLGQSLPRLSRQEMTSGLRSYLGRRRAYLRNFGLRSLLQSL